MNNFHKPEKSRRKKKKPPWEETPTRGKWVSDQMQKTILHSLFLWYGVYYVAFTVLAMFQKTSVPHVRLGKCSIYKLLKKLV